MTDEPDVPPGDSPEDDAVRRLLADARHDAPMPADVAARMDRVLADLAASPSAEEPAPVVPTDDPVVTRLPARRRCHAAALLGAAAAIVVGGVVLAQNRPLDTASPTAGSAASGTESNDRFSAGARGNDQAGSAPGPARAFGSTQGHKVVVRDGRVVVRRQSFARDALAGRALLARVPRASSPDLAQVPCRPPSRSEQSVPALYDKAPAELVYHRPNGSTQVVDLVVCGSSVAVRSVTLPAP